MGDILVSEELMRRILNALEDAINEYEFERGLCRDLEKVLASGEDWEPIPLVKELRQLMNAEGGG